MTVYYPDDDETETLPARFLKREAEEENSGGGDNSEEVDVIEKHLAIAIIAENCKDPLTRSNLYAEAAEDASQAGQFKLAGAYSCKAEE